MADYKEGIVESIKIATLEKQIEILEKLGLSKDEILAKMSDENADILTIILNKIDSLYEQEEQKLVEQLARTLLANQSEASLKYVLEHKLIGKVIKHITDSSNDSFNNKTFEDILKNKVLYNTVMKNDSLKTIFMSSNSFMSIVVKRSVFSSIFEGNTIELREYWLSNTDFVKKIYTQPKLHQFISNDTYVIFNKSSSAWIDALEPLQKEGKIRFLPLGVVKLNDENYVESITASGRLSSYDKDEPVIGPPSFNDNIYEWIDNLEYYKYMQFTAPTVKRELRYNNFPHIMKADMTDDNKSWAAIIWLPHDSSLINNILIKTSMVRLSEFKQKYPIVEW